MEEEVQNQHADESFNKFNWKIENVSKLRDKDHFSPIFRIGGHKWKLLAFCGDCNMNNYLSVYVVSVGCENWRFTQFSLAVVDQANNKNTLKKDTEAVYLFTEGYDRWGFVDFIRLKELKDPSNGYIKNDACIIEVEFSLNSIQDFKQELVPMELTESAEEVQERSFGIETTTSNDTLPASSAVCLDNNLPFSCAFCKTSTVSKTSGSMLHIVNGEEVIEDEVSAPNVIHVHRKCIEWAPQVYYVGKTVINLELELARASELKCSCCGLQGAALGCFIRSCRNTYHIPCAFDTSGCQWDEEGRLMLCPNHSSMKFSDEKTKKRKKLAEDSSSVVQREKGKKAKEVAGECSLPPRRPGGPKLRANQRNKGDRICIGEPTAVPRAEGRGEQGGEEGCENKEKKKKGSHIPPPHLMIDDREDGKPHGLPNDGGKLLFGYGSSWAKTIYSTEDHTDAIRLLRPTSSASKMKEWNLEEKECARVVELVEKSGLLPAVKNSVIAHDYATISAFLERFYGETDTFHLPCGEVMITPDDANKILDLKIEGKCVNENYTKQLNWEQMYSLTKDCFGWDEETSKAEFKKSFSYRVRQFNLVVLRDTFMGTKDLEKEGKLDDSRVTATATAYLLYLLGCVIFPNSSGSRVDANLLQLLHPLDKVHEYSWGTACLAHLTNEMRRASREMTSQISGNVTLLQVFIYDHFPTLGRGVINPAWREGSPRGTKYIFPKSQVKKSAEKLISLRRILDNITVDEVCFDPYKVEGEQGRLPRSDISLYYGPLWYPTGYVMCNASRVMRQHGYVQHIPSLHSNDNFRLSLNDCEHDNVSITVVHTPNPTYTHWNDRQSYMVNPSMPADQGIEASRGYMAWYRGVTHLRVVREEIERPSKFISIFKNPLDQIGYQRLKNRMAAFSKKISACIDAGVPMSIEKQKEYKDLVENLDNENYGPQFGEKKQKQTRMKETPKAKRSRGSTSGGGEG